MLRNEDLLFNGYMVLALKMKKTFEMNGNDECTAMNALNATKLPLREILCHVHTTILKIIF